MASKLQSGGPIIPQADSLQSKPVIQKCSTAIKINKMIWYKLDKIFYAASSCFA